MIRAILWDPKFLPTVLIAIDVLAAFRYGAAGSRKHFTYWIAAAVLTYSVTWMDK